MSLHSIRLAFAAVLAAAIFSGCGGGDSASPPVGGLTVVPGDSQVTVTWNAESGVDYWLFYAPAPSITTSDWVNIPGSRVLVNVASPLVITGLQNGTTYSFAMNGRVDRGPAGDGTPSVSATPRLAGGTWTIGGTLGTGTVRGITYGTAAGATTNTYVAVGSGGSIFRSDDGLAWTAIATTGTNDLNAVTFAANKYVAVGASGTILYSTDITNWTAATSATQKLNALANNAGIIVAVGDAGTILFSTDGVTWTPAATNPTTSNLHGVSFTPSGTWIAVGAGGTLIRSADASNWTSVSSGTTADLNAATMLVTTVNQVTTYTYLAVGDGGTVLTSGDSTTWTSRALGSTANLSAVQASGQFVAVGAGGSAFTSPDGTTWTSQATGTPANLFALIKVPAQYIAVGQNGVSIYSR